MASKNEFYQGKSVVKVEWWLSWASLPELYWARLRVFDERTCYVCFEESDKLYGFESKANACYFLTEDEYSVLDEFGEEGEKDFETVLSVIQPPCWEDSPDQEFEYLGRY